MILQGLVLLAPSLSFKTAAFSCWALKWRVWSYGVWYWWAPALPLDTFALSRFDEGVKGKVLRGLVLLCPLPLSL